MNPEHTQDINGDMNQDLLKRCDEYLDCVTYDPMRASRANDLIRDLRNALALQQGLNRPIAVDDGMVELLRNIRHEAQDSEFDTGFETFRAMAIAALQANQKGKV